MCSRRIHWPVLVLIAGLCLFISSAFSAPAHAKGKTTKRGSSAAPSAGKASGSRSFTFEDMLVDGEVLKPQIMYTKVLDRAKFDRLLRLRTSFLRRMLQTYRYPCLRRGR